ncbi:MAG: hypothetical protein NWF14_03620 [Candidatus Bathyarchaeota archaeon]|nr:hypothetical protein [Candidatus Bathyarchaeota archaeon]
MSERTESEETAKPPVHIKMKVGNIEFEIECREDQVREMVDKVLSSATEYASKPIATPLERAPPPTRAETCRGIVERLWREGWFVEPRSLGDVHDEMTRIGYHYDRTAVAHVLLDLVRDGLLTRQGKPRRYFYVQKRPPAVS